MATTSGSVFAANGLSGEAAGSCQSPNWKPPDHTPRVAAAAIRSTQPRMLANCRHRTSTSPKCRYSTHGTTVAASPHAVAAGESVFSTSGTTNGTEPSSNCSLARSFSHDDRNPAVSNRNDAVGENTWMSPVQPSRSSRCGQSVGRSTKLPRLLHTTLSWIRFQQRLRAPEPPVAAQVAAHDQTLHIGHGEPVDAADLGVAETVERELGLERHLAGVIEDIRISRFGTAQRPRAQLAVCQHLRVAHHHLLAGLRTTHAQPHPADEVLPEVDQSPAGRRFRKGNRPQHLGHPHRRAVGCDERGEVRVEHPRHRPQRTRVAADPCAGRRRGRRPRWSSPEPSTARRWRRPRSCRRGRSPPAGPAARRGHRRRRGGRSSRAGRGTSRCRAARRASSRRRAATP